MANNVGRADGRGPTAATAGPLGAVHHHQLSWHPFARVVWWLALLPVAIFAWSSWRLRGGPRVIGYLVAGFVLLVGITTATGSSPPAPTATSAAPLATPSSAALTPAPLYVAPTTTIAPAPPSSSTYTPYVAVPPPALSPASGYGDGNTYTNVDGNQVERPVQANSKPAGATAQCRDGSYSFSQHRQGTCSGHGGVAQSF